MLRRVERESKGREARMWKLIGVFVVAVMFFGSTIGYVFFYTGKSNTGNQDNANTENTYAYKGYNFISSQQGWLLNTPQRQLITNFLPQQTLDVDCECSLLNSLALQGQKAYVIAKTDAESRAASELLRNSNFANTQIACLPEEEKKTGCLDRPLRSCEDATAQQKILIFKEIDKIFSEREEVAEGGISKVVSERVTYKDNCLIVEGKDLVKAVDRVIYKAYWIE